MPAGHERDGSRPSHARALQRRFAQHAVAGSPLLELEHRDSRRVVRLAADELGGGTRARRATPAPRECRTVSSMGTAAGRTGRRRSSPGNSPSGTPPSTSTRTPTTPGTDDAAYQLGDTGAGSPRSVRRRRPPRSTVTMRRSIATPRSGVARGTRCSGRARARLASGRRGARGRCPRRSVRRARPRRAVRPAGTTAARRPRSRPARPPRATLRTRPR